MAALSGGGWGTVDKVFLPSSTEMGYVNFTEGSQLSKFTDEASRMKTLSSGQYGSYWLRSTGDKSSEVKRIATISAKPNHLIDKAYRCIGGIAPIIVLH